MGWDVELCSRKTGKIMTLANPFYKRGSNVRAKLGPDGKLHPVVEADLSITFNYSGYYYEAGDGDTRFRTET